MNVETVAHDLVLEGGFPGLCRAVIALRQVRQHDVACHLGLSEGKLSALLNGRRPIPESVVVGLCAELRIDDGLARASFGRACVASPTLPARLTVQPLMQGSTPCST